MRLLCSRGEVHAPRCGALPLMVESSMGLLARYGHWREVSIGDEVAVGKRTSLASNISFGLFHIPISHSIALSYAFLPPSHLQKLLQQRKRMPISLVGGERKCGGIGKVCAGT